MPLQFDLEGHEKPMFKGRAPAAAAHLTEQKLNITSEDTKKWSYSETPSDIN